MSMGFFQTRPADEIQRALIVALVAAGATFIITLVSLALLLLVVDPTKVTTTVDRPLLLPKDAPDATPSGPASTPEAPRTDDGPGRSSRLTFAPRAWPPLRAWPSSLAPDLRASRLAFAPHAGLRAFGCCCGV